MLLMKICLPILFTHEHFSLNGKVFESSMTDTVTQNIIDPFAYLEPFLEFHPKVASLKIVSILFHGAELNFRRTEKQ